MSHEDPGNVSYSEIGGLSEQIRELREVRPASCPHCCAGGLTVHGAVPVQGAGHQPGQAVAQLALLQVIELPLTNPELFQRVGIIPPKGCLLYGPPGWWAWCRPCARPCCCLLIMTVFHRHRKDTPGPSGGQPAGLQLPQGESRGMRAHVPAVTCLAGCNMSATLAGGVQLHCGQVHR